MDLKEVIGRNITKRREELNLTQPELSSLTGISKGQISEYERFISLPKSDALYKLAIAMHTDINYFYNGADKLNENNISKELIVIYKALSNDSQLDLIEYAKFLVKKIRINNVCVS
jgi:transcriptional regulator with XRE-family HTH domain